MRFEIRGKMHGRAVEIVDTAETLKEAQYLLGEYRMAFGSSWSLWVTDTEATSHASPG